MTADDVTTPGLRDRRRLDTHQEIHLAALELFEEQGIRASTVQQIADRAGVSPRTFFRYFTSKEQAALPGQRRLLRVIEALEIPDGDAVSILRAVEDATEAAMAAPSDPEVLDEPRVARLLAKEPDLRAMAAAQEQILVARLRARLVEQLSDSDPLEILVTAEIAVVTWRATWERWGELVLSGSSGELLEVYRATRAALRRIVD